MQSYRLSPSTLNIFLECPHCFWLAIKQGLKRPEQPSSTLPRGMDLLIKKYFDKWRTQKLPPELRGKIAGELVQDQQLIDTWRNMRKGLQYTDKSLGSSVIFGLLDECVVDGDIYMPADYKTRGFNLKENSTGYYQNQLDCYTLLLKLNNYKINNKGYLIFYILDSLGDNGNSKFRIEPIEMKTDPSRAYDTFKRAVELLEGPAPKLNAACPFCSWALNQKDK